MTFPQTAPSEPRDTSTTTTTTTTAMKKRSARRTVQIVTALTYCLFSVGICFGFAALKPILIDSGVYEDKCSDQPHTLSTTTTTTGGSGWVARCVRQELALNQMFTWAAVGTNVSAFPIGLILDRYGPRVTSLIGSVLMFFGSLGLSLARSEGGGWWDIYVPAYTVLATAGSFLLLSSFSLASLVPSKSGLIVSGMTGAFDASSGLFLVYRLVYQAVRRPSIVVFFRSYLVVPVLIFTVQMWYMPKRSTDEAKIVVAATDGEDHVGDETPGVTETTNLLEHTERTRMYDSSSSSAVKGEAATVEDPLDGVMHEASNTSALFSLWFLGPALVMIASLIRVNFFIATVHAQLIFFVGEADAVGVMDMFDILLPVGGLLAIPLIGWILDTYTTATVYALTLGLSLVSGLLSFVPNKYGQIGHILTFVVLRPWIYSILPGTVTKLFGKNRFGAFYGLIMAVAGLVNLLAHPLEVLTYGRYGGSFLPVNTGLVCASVPTLMATVVHMQLKVRQS